MSELVAWPPGKRVVYWLRHGWDNTEHRIAAVCEWARANDLDPDRVYADDPFLVGRPEDATLCQGPTVTVTVDEATDGGPPSWVRRTVPLKVPPPPDLFLDVATEVQRAAAGDPAMRTWLAECLSREAVDGPGQLA